MGDCESRVKCGNGRKIKKDCHKGGVYGMYYLFLERGGKNSKRGKGGHSIALTRRARPEEEYRVR